MPTIRAVPLTIVVMLAASVTSAAAQQYPTKPIRMIIPSAPGGSNDVVGRPIATFLGERLGRQIIIDNRAGAGTMIGTEIASKAPNDGYTLAVWHIGQSTAPALYENLKYNAIEDFDSIGRITDVPMTVVGKADLPIKGIGELLAWMKEKQKGVTYAHAGIGSASHLCALLLMHATKTEMTAVAYRGTGPAMNDLLGGQFDMMCDQTTGTTNPIKAGKIKGYAATTPARLKVLPELPTLDESGLKGFEVAAWHAMWAPKGLPKDVTDKLVNALQVALRDEKVMARFADLGTEPVSQALATPDALKRQLASEVAKWGPIIKAAGVKGN